MTLKLSSHRGRERLWRWMILLIAAPTLVTISIASELAPLADAIEAQESTQITQLLENGAEIDTPQVDGMTPLLWAIYHNDSDLSLQLLERGASPTKTNHYGVAPLTLACQNGNSVIVKALLTKGADPNTTFTGGETALMSAARTGAVDAVGALIAAGADVDKQERTGQTAAMWAAAEGHLEVIELLRTSGADLDRQLKKSGFNPFFFAVRAGHTEIVRHLLAAGAEINAIMRPDNPRGKLPRRGTSPLVLAIENGHYDLAVELLEAGADPNDDRSGYTPLHTLTWIRKPDIGESSAGDPKPQGSGRRTTVDMVRSLIAHGADVNAQLKRGRRAGRGHVSVIGATPFFLASDRADLEYMKLLVELGADPFLPNEDGTTPLLVAAGIGSTAPEEEAGNEAECLAAVKYLVSLGAKINTVDGNGETAMHGAAYKNIPSMAHYLNERGADIHLWNTKNKLGWTPLLIAEGYRPGNFKPSFVTAEAITAVMLANGVKPPTGPKPKHTNYAN